MVAQSLQQACLLVGEEALLNPAWTEYGQYCLHREKGLRGKAFAHLEIFLTQASEWRLDEKKEFVVWLCGKMDSIPYAGHWPYPTPLANGFVSPVIDECIEREPAIAELLVLKVRYAGDFDAYSKAISIDPRNQEARIALAHQCIYDIWFATHHLPEFFIGKESDVSAVVSNAEEHIAHLHSGKDKEYVLSELRHETQLFNDWIEFKEQRGDDFDRWCKEKGRHYSWLKAYYYDK